MNKKLFIGLMVILCALIVYALSPPGATNFDRIVLGSGNYGEDPNTTADITFQNDEYITNSTDGTLDFGAANLTTTGAISNVGAITIDTADVGVVDELLFALHTVAAGDSALGNIFLSASDTVLYIGTGSDLVSIADAAP